MYRNSEIPGSAASRLKLGPAAATVFLSALLLSGCATFSPDGEQVAFTWDGENRLASMQSLSSVPSGAKKKLDFTYDYGGRRIQKVVSTWNGSAWVKLDLVRGLPRSEKATPPNWT